MRGETFSHDLCLFFNELELCAKTARSSRIIRMSHLRSQFLWSLHLTKLCSVAPCMQARSDQLLFMELANHQS